MKKITYLLTGLLSALALITQAAEKPSQETVPASAHDHPFLNGELNPEYDGQVTVLVGEVIDIKPGVKYALYKVDTKTKDIKPIWVTTLVPVASGEIKLGDRLIFRGYITKTESLDPSGKLLSMIRSETLLSARAIESPN